MGAPPLCAYTHAAGLLLCKLPQGHRQIGKVHGSPRTRPQGRGNRGPVLTPRSPSVFFLGGKNVCWMSAQVLLHWRRCSVYTLHSQVHPSCSIKFKTLLNTEIKHSIPGNPPSLGALHGTLHNTEVSASLPPGGTPPHSAHSEPAGARPLKAACMPRSMLSRVAFLPASCFPPHPASS